MAIAAPRKLDSRTAEEHLSLELLARRQEAGMFAVALRTVVRQLEASCSRRRPTSRSRRSR
jgi:hypothetical protein